MPGIIAGKRLRELVFLHQPPLVEGVAEMQLQPDGVELTVDRVLALSGAGYLGAENADRQVAPTEEVKPNGQGWWKLPSGVYRLVLSEAVHIPSNICAIARPRSSLLRSGVSLGTALWDSGYEGRSEVLCMVHNPKGFRLQRGARVLQLIFFELEEEVEGGYEGKYQGENM
jgi:dUTP pyrophosphatase